MKRVVLLAVLVLAAAAHTVSVAQVSSPYLDITSLGYTTYTVGQNGSFLVTTEPTAMYAFPGPPVLAITANGPPPGVSFTDNGDGTAAIAGTPIFSGDSPFVISAYAPGPAPGMKGVLLVQQPFIASVNPGQTKTELATLCERTFTEGQPFTYYANISPVGTGAIGVGTMTYTQDPGSNVLCAIDISVGNNCTTTALATTGADTQDNYTLGASYSGNTSWLPSTALPIGVTVLSAADVVFRNSLEFAPDGCPAE